MDKRKKEIGYLLACAGVLCVAPFLGFAQWFLSFLIMFSVASMGYIIGLRWITSNRVEQFLWGMLGTTTILMLVRGAWFYLGFNLNGWGDMAPVAVTLVIGAIWLKFDKRDIAQRATGNGQRAGSYPDAPCPLPPARHTLFAIISPTLSLVALILIAYTAFHSGTSESIRTPWPFMPGWTLPLIALLWIFALATAWKLKNRIVTAIQVSAAIASTTFIAPLLYKIGYGFDGFLHIAGEKVLLETGTLAPKPAYYMGQYVFTTWLSKLFELDITDIDRWLVPVCAAILIPLALMLVAQTKRAIILPAIILMPITAFIATTPHGFATVLGIIALILCISVTLDREVDIVLPLIFACWSALTHPLIGLPILCATLMAVISPRSTYNAPRMIFSWPLAILAGFSVPLVFGLATAIGSSAGVSFEIGNLFSANAWQNLIASWLPWVQNRYAIWPEASVWVEKLLPWITIIFAFLALKRSKRQNEKQPLWIIAALSTAAAAIILSLAGDFGFLIDYERGNYAERLWMVAWLLLLPLAVPELAIRLEKARNASGASLLAVLIAIGVLGAGASYAALPRHDAVTPSRGWSVGSYDIEAVKLIDEDSEGRDYTVLANQSVSAAAVRTYGFKRYHDDVFFYPIPTGGKLYEIYLRASYEDPSRETMVLAGNLGGSDLVYLVVNDYWWDAEALIERARPYANRVFDIGDGKVWIFRYDLTEPVIIEESEDK